MGWFKKPERTSKQPRPPRRIKRIGGQAINPRRRAERIAMRALGITRKKAYRKLERKQRRLEREALNRREGTDEMENKTGLAE